MSGPLARVWRVAVMEWSVAVRSRRALVMMLLFTAVATMNEVLRDTMEALAEEIEKAGKVSPELGLRMMGDLTRNMAEAYDAIGAAVPPERRAEVSEIPVHEFIDPMVAEPLIGVQDKLDGGFMGRGGTK